jgi:PAS domain S-box-containing protein
MAVLVVDEHGRIVHVNRYAGRLVGWKPPEAARKPIGTLFPEPFGRPGNEDAVFHELRERLRRPERGGAAVAFRATGRSAAGVEASYQMQVQELPGSSRSEYVCLVRMLREEPAVAAPIPKERVVSDSAVTIDGLPNLEPVDLSPLLDAVVKDVDAAIPEGRRRIAMMKPASVKAQAHARSVLVVLREVFDAALRAAVPSAVINVTVTETHESVGVMVEAPVAMDADRPAAVPPLVFAGEVTRALGGTLEVYDDIPGSLQIVVELQRAVGS